MLSNDDLAAIRKRVDAASPGKWESYWRETDDRADCGVFYEKLEGHAYSVCRCPQYQKEEVWLADGEFIAHSKDDVINLLAEVDRLKKIVGEK